MKYTIQYMPKAIKQLAHIPSPFREAIVEVIARLAHRDQWIDVKHLVKHQYQYRLRVGNYRVLFDVEDTTVTIYICEVKKRDNRAY